ncbi:MAG TPA: NAD(P)/FAD-dependent oxidoreductase [Chitinophagales bacterium]|nr:NAD(P)/FAD-dependent oxidoreductase [Chitinophagales bacterium]
MLDVIIVGAGLSGLSAAYQLQQKGYKVAIYEANGKVGGRCKSDYIDGYILDKGLHFFQKGYTESKNTFDYKPLRMESIYPGAMIHFNNNFHLVTNPLRNIGDVFSMAFLPFMSFGDKIKLGSMLTYLMTSNDDQLKKWQSITTMDYLKSRGFSDKLIETLFRPLCHAIYFDPSLQTSAYLFTSMMKSFAFEESALPAYGIGSIAVQLGEKLEENTVHFHSKVKNVFEDRVELTSGEVIHARKVIVSIPPQEVEKIFPERKNKVEYSPYTCLYFSTKTPPVKSAIILLNGKKEGIVNHVFVPTTIQPSYAPPGNHLVCVTLRSFEDKEEDELIDDILTELIDWFGVKVNDWMHIKTYHIQSALPTIHANHEIKYSEVDNGIHFCGDSLSYGSVDNALISGKATAQAVMLELNGTKKMQRKPAFFH